MRTVYQPCVSGENCLGHRATRFSRKIYVTEEAARAGIPDFLKRLERKHEHDIGYLGTVDADDVKIIELELVKGV